MKYKVKHLQAKWDNKLIEAKGPADAAIKWAEAMWLWDYDEDIQEGRGMPVSVVNLEDCNGEGRFKGWPMNEEVIFHYTIFGTRVIVYRIE